MRRILTIGKPGAGKTSSLLKQALSHPTWRIITFSRKNANDIRTKIKATRFLSDQELNKRVTTLHAWAFRELGYKKEMNLQRLLQRRGRDLGFAFGKRLLQSFTKEEIIGDLPVETEDDLAYSEASRLRLLGLTAKDTAFQGYGAKRVHDVFKMWDKAWQYGFFDFTRLLEEADQARSVIQDEFIGFDEINDFSPLMFRIAERAKGDQVIFSGDPDQTLYSFMGSRPQEVFKIAFDEQNILEESHRVPSLIAAYADKTLDGATFRAPGHIKSLKEGGTLTTTPTIEGVYNRIRQDPARYGHIFVLARTNSLVRKYEDLAARMEMNLPTKDGLDALRTLIAYPPDTLMAYDIMTLCRLPEDGSYLKKGAKTTLKLQAKDGIDFQDVLRYTVGNRLRLAFKTQNLDLLKDIGYQGRTFDPSKPIVNILTMHAAKGMEADTVVRSKESTERVQDMSNNDDEIRLKYVTITRTKRNLIETYGSESNFISRN